jgi:acetyl-CoA C-acetyltransferase
MSDRIAIVGIGATQFRSISPDLSYKELMFEAATKAFEDCGIDPRKDVDTFVTCAEDYIEGTSIFDEYTPDQLGAVLKPMHTITQEGLTGLASVYLQLRTGQFEVGVVEAHAKNSNLLTPDGIAACALDPIYNRPLRINHHAIAGLEMHRFMYETGITEEQCAKVVIKNRKNALDNPFAAYGANLTIKDITNNECVASPCDKLHIAQPADGAVVIVLATEEKARALTKKPVWIRGVGWINFTPTLESRDWAKADYCEKAAEMAYKMAGIKQPMKEIDFAEIDDTFSYKELQHLAAMKLGCECDMGTWMETGATQLNGEFPVNPSGGSLGMGHLLDASGLARVFMAVKQLRNEAGTLQVKNANTALIQGWRGLPTTSGAVAILSN